jgi:acetolactate synthase-1/2/3 large subunit
VSLVRAIAKSAELVDDPATIRYHFERAVWHATHGRPGPVWLDLPLDVQGAMVDEAALAPFDPAELGDEAVAPAVEPGAIAETIARLAAARRPVILAGNGIRLAHAIPEFHALVERLGIPVVTSINGIDLIWDDHPLFMGRPNYWGQRAANFVVQNADVLLTIGSGVHLELTGFNYGLRPRGVPDHGEHDAAGQKTFVPDLAIRPT